MKIAKSALSALLLTTAISLTTSAVAGPVPVDYFQNSGFLFNSLTPTETLIGRHDGDLGLSAPSGSPWGAGSAYQSLWWGNDGPSREQNSANGTPIVTSGSGLSWTGTAAWWTSNSTPDSALKVVPISGTAYSVHTYVDPFSVLDPIAAGWAPLSATFHSNQTISDREDGILTSGVVRSNLTIGSLLDLNDVAFSFFETPNANSAYDCPDASGDSCDLFKFDAAGFAPLVYNDGTNYFDVYFSIIGISSGAWVIDSTSTWGGGGQCGITEFCILTKEDEVNYMVVGMLLVPEPGSLALAGLGLVSLAFLRRRRLSR